MNDNIIYMPKTVEIMTCGECENTTFILVTDGLIHCSECSALQLTVKWGEE